MVVVGVLAAEAEVFVEDFTVLLLLLVRVTVVNVLEVLLLLADDEVLLVDEPNYYWGLLRSWSPSCWE